MVCRGLDVAKMVAIDNSDNYCYTVYRRIDQILRNLNMSANNEEYLKLHADFEWSMVVFDHIQELLTNDPLEPDDIEAIKWLVKQGLACMKIDSDTSKNDSTVSTVFNELPLL